MNAPEVRFLWVVQDSQQPGGVEAVVRTLHAGLIARGLASEVLSWRTSADAPPPAASWLGGQLAAQRHLSRLAGAAADEVAARLAADPHLVAVLDPASAPVAAHLAPSTRWVFHVHWSPEMLLEPWRFYEEVPHAARALSFAFGQLRRLQRRRILRRAPATVTLLPSHSAALRPHARSIAEIPNPFTGSAVAAAWRREDARRLAGGSGVAFVGRLSWEKGPDTFIEALANLRDRGVLVPAVVAGSGPMEQRLREMVLEFRLNNVDFVGWVPESRILLDHTDVVVLTSRSEGSPLVLVEGLAAGCSVVATAAGSGVSDILRGGLLGRIVPVGDSVAVADAIEATLEDSALGLRPDPDAIALLLEERDLDVVLDRWVKLAHVLVAST